MILNPWKRLREAEEANQDLVNLLVAKEDHIDDLILRNAELNDLLLEIIKKEKPTSNATVKRMANIARHGVSK